MPPWTCEQSGAISTLSGLAKFDHRRSMTLRDLDIRRSNCHLEYDRIQLQLTRMHGGRSPKEGQQRINRLEHHAGRKTPDMRQKSS